MNVDKRESSKVRLTIGHRMGPNHRPSMHSVFMSHTRWSEATSMAQFFMASRHRKTQKMIDEINSKPGVTWTARHNSRFRGRFHLIEGSWRISRIAHSR